MEQLIFDYKSAAKDLRLPSDLVRDIEKEVRQEFPNDPMLMELHILRALRSYAAKNVRK
ncbi:MAG: hypothetical protein LBL33_05195 [Tannerella sp.]|jgi:hypothetical protein|nr:hypothetical protein [Tannerella sp.]